MRAWSGLISELDYCPIQVDILSVFILCCFKLPYQRTSGGEGNELIFAQDLVFVLDNLSHFIVCDNSCSVFCEMFPNIRMNYKTETFIGIA
jgi:hypothetical protein